MAVNAMSTGKEKLKKQLKKRIWLAAAPSAPVLLVVGIVVIVTVVALASMFSTTPTKIGKGSSCGSGGSVAPVADVLTFQVPGLQPTQSANADIIVTTAAAAGVGDPGAKLAIAVALAESSLSNDANDGTDTQTSGHFPGKDRAATTAELAVAKQSIALPHDRVTHVLDSMGVFNMRPSIGDGAPGVLMNPASATNALLKQLDGVTGWQSMSQPWLAAQTITHSTSASAFAAQWSKASAIVTAINGARTAAAQLAATPGAKPSIKLPDKPITAAAFISALCGSPCGSIGTGTDISGVHLGGPASLGQWNAAQMTIARQIASVAVARGLGPRAELIGIMAGIAESSLTNVDHGDAAGPSSIGVFQQMPSWGPNRTDPVGAAGYFFDSMVGKAGWQTLDEWIVAQRVEESEFVPGYTGEGSDGTEGFNYRRVMPDAQAILTSFGGAAAAAPAGQVGKAGGLAPAAAKPAAVALAPACTGGSAGSIVVANGPVITFPSVADVPPELWGKTITAPNAAMAKGLVAAFRAIGTPYVFGGGGNGSVHPDESADDGCARAGTHLYSDNNNCTGAIGYDCSGITGYTLFTAGFGPLSGSSADQRVGGIAIPISNGLPGDLLGYQGHITVYLGVVAGSGSTEPYLLEAPTEGQNVSIRHVYPNNEGAPHDTDLRRYWH